MRTPFLPTCLLILLLGNSALVQADIHQDNLLGSWNCSVSHEEEGVKINFQTRDTYTADGQITSTGNLSIHLLDTALVYDFSSTSSWSLNGSMLATTLDSIDMQLRSPSELGSLLNSEELFPKGMTATVEILSLTARSMTIRDTQDNLTYQCHR